MSVQCRVRACSSFPRSARARAAHIPERESLLFLLWPRSVPRAPLYSSLFLSLSFFSPPSPLPCYIRICCLSVSPCVYTCLLLSFLSLFFLSLSLHMYTCVYVYEYILSSGRVRVRLLYPASSLSLLVARVPELSSLELLRINLYVYVYTCSSQCLHSTCTSCTFRIIVDVWMETPSSCVALSVSHRVGGSSHPHRRVGVHADETGTGRLDRHVAVAVLASRCF